MSSTSIKTIDLPRAFEPSSDSTLALCTGDSFVTRLDFEVSHWISTGKSGKSSVVDVVGIFVTCSDKSPKQAILFPKKINTDTPKALFHGPDAPNGIRDMVVNGKLSVESIGYADALVGIVSGDSLMSVAIWRQVDSEYASCALKGIEAAPKRIFGESADKVRLHFNCPSNITIPTPTSTSRARPPPGTTRAAVLMTEGSSASSASSSTSEASSGNSTLIIVIGSVGGVVLLLIGVALFVRNRRQLHK